MDIHVDMEVSGAVSELMSDVSHIVRSNSAALCVATKPLSERAVKANITVSEAKPTIMSVCVSVSVCVHVCVLACVRFQTKTRQQLLSLSTIRHFQMATNNPQR